jgi:hypothetical protein
MFILVVLAIDEAGPEALNGRGAARLRIRHALRLVANLCSTNGSLTDLPRVRNGAGRAVPADKAECRLRVQKETIAGMRRNGRDAPIPDLPAFG